MGNRRFTEAVEVVLRHEGGFVNHPRDPGGLTNMGITARTLADHRGVPLDRVTETEMRALPRAEAEEIYLSRFWNVIRGDDLPRGLDLAVFDWAVNSGPRRAVRALQRLVGARTDGIVGQETLAAVRSRDVVDLVRALCDARLAFVRGLSTHSTFGRGWERRITDVRNLASAWAVQPTLSTREALGTDTVKAGVAAATGTAALAAGADEFVEAVQPLLPFVASLPAIAGYLIVVALVVAAVIWWRKRRA